MPSRLARVAVLLAFLLALSFTACGGDGDKGGGAERAKESSFRAEPVDLPEGVVAVVGTHVISRSRFEAWLQLLGQDQMRNGGIPDEFVNCETWIGNLFRHPKEMERPFPDELPNARCERRFEEEIKQPLEPSTLELLIRVDWVDREARAQGVTATAAEARRGRERELKAAFEEPRYRRDYVKSLSRWELRQGLVAPRLQVLLRKLLAKRRQSQPSVTERDVRAFYSRNKAKYRTSDGTEPLAEHRKEIVRILGTRRESALQPRFIAYMYRKYRRITKCAPEVRIPMCSNGPKPGRAPVPKT